MSNDQVDSIIDGDWVVTMEAGERVIEKGAVAVLDGKIVAVGAQADIHATYSADSHIDGAGKVLMPGLINGHTHTSMTLFRGLADDLDLMTWLTQYIFPMEGQFVSPDFVKLGTELACYEMIKTGTTTFVDMYFYPDVIAEAAVACGVRAVVTSPMIDFPSPGFKGWDDSFKAGVDFVKRWQGKHDRITPGLAPHAPYTVAPAHLTQALKAATALDAPISMHLAEDKSEEKTIGERYATTPVTHAANLGMLDHRLIAAHVVWPTEAEIDMMVGKPIGPIHNPTSNLKLGAGISPVPKMMAKGIPVGLGTDGAASNNDLNMWDEIRLASLIHKVDNQDPKAMPAEMSLALATRSGAQAIGMGDQIGTLAAGKAADMIQVSLSRPELAPLYNVISHLVYAVTSQDVTMTMVAGTVLMQDGQVLTLDGEKLRKDAQATAQEIKAALKK